MKFLCATTTEGKPEYFNLSQILTITPINEDTVKILMGAGLFWHVERDSMRVWDMSDREIGEI